MELTAGRARRLARVLTVAAFGTLVVGVGTPAFGASPSDDRAEFHDGNATRCDQIDGVPDEHFQVSGQGSSAGGDGFVEVTTEGKKRVNVEITSDGEDAGVVVDAVVVKGGDGYNVYRDPYVPPALDPPQNYISPLNMGGNVADISHWFVCYSLDETPPAGEGALIVAKEVVTPDGTPVAPLPEEYTVTVTCTGEDYDETFIVTFGPAGGLPNEGIGALTGLPVDAVCTVEENVSGLPDDAVVSYHPPEALTEGVTVEDGAFVIVKVVNDFSGVEVLTGEVEVVKVVSASGPVDLPESFTANLTCSDGTAEEITLPGDGGAGSPVVEVTAGADCIVEEGSVPEGWTVTYTVDGSHDTEQASFVVAPDETTEVTVTNSASSPSPTLPNTGAMPTASSSLPLAAVGVLGLGALALLSRFVITARR
jgi:hypothetical protein